MRTTLRTRILDGRLLFLFRANYIPLGNLHWHSILPCFYSVLLRRSSLSSIHHTRSWTLVPFFCSSSASRTQFSQNRDHTRLGGGACLVFLLLLLCLFPSVPFPPNNSHHAQAVSRTKHYCRLLSHLICPRNVHNR